MTPLAKMRLTGALDQAERAETSVMARREGRRPTPMPDHLLRDRQPWTTPTNPETLQR